jgi:pyrimidine operon attenuation protein/uracil phosphoribosyltransferase
MQTVQTKNSVLGKESINRKMRRMALEIAEQNIDEKDIIIAGIAGNGEVVARCLVRQLNEVSKVSTKLLTILLNKKDPLQASFDQKMDFENKVIIIVDDVADTGRTMLYALRPFLDFHPKKIQTLVLVERSHKLFPIQTDYTGLSITTTLQEHISVETNGDELTGAWLY